jgi:hypothetical protein
MFFKRHQCRVWGIMASKPENAASSVLAYRVAFETANSELTLIQAAMSKLQQKNNELKELCKQT